VYYTKKEMTKTKWSSYANRYWS